MKQISGSAPLILSLLATAFSAQAFAAEGSLVVTSAPAGAEVWVDGNRIGGVTPISSQPVEEGGHRLLLRKSGFADYEEEIRVTAGQTTEIKDVTLRAIPKAVAERDDRQERKIASPWMFNLFDIIENYSAWPGQNSLNLALGAGVQKKFWGVVGIKARYYYLPINASPSNAAYIKESGWRVGLPIYFGTWATRDTSAGKKGVAVSSLYVIPELGKGTVEVGNKSGTGKTVKVTPVTYSDESYTGLHLGYEYISYSDPSSLGAGIQVEGGYGKPTSDVSSYGVKFSVVLAY